MAERSIRLGWKVYRTPGVERRRALGTLSCLVAVVVAAGGVSAQDDAWSHYGGDPGGRRYSALREIDRGNVNRLQQVWVAHTGELGERARDGADLTFESTPVIFEGLLFVTTGFSDVVALDPATGETRWRHDSAVPRTRSYSEITSRGVATWSDTAAPAGSSCARRVFVATIDARLVALDATRGAPCAGFGRGGVVDLAAGVGMSGNGDYQVTSPPAVLGDLLVVGSSIGDNWNAATADGRVRAFDARTGALRWSWSPIEFRREGDVRVGAGNAWAPASTDPVRGLVFVATSSPSPDFYGGLRPGDNRDANSLVALDAATGTPKWSFQVVHHDLWDFDLGAQPTLFELDRGGRTIDGVAQATKIGLLYLFDRETGEPLHPVEERAAPSSDVPGEAASPTQPFPTRPRPLVPLDGAPSEERVWGLNEADREDCRELLRGVRSAGPFSPPSLRGTVLWPGNSGGTRWAGVAWDPMRRLLIVPSVRRGTLVQLLPRAEIAAARRGGDGEWEYGLQGGAPYGMRRRELTSRRGVPCSPPPWGTLAAIDPAAGEVVWEVPLGEVRADHPLVEEYRVAGVQGMSHAGGPIVTAGGLIFIAGTSDRQIRALDVESGRELWRAELPRAGIATPMTYFAGGRQYVAIAAGGHGKAGLPLGDTVVSFALPR